MHNQRKTVNILVTGGAGYIGSHTILEIFAKTSWDVVAVDNFNNSDQKTYDRIKEISGRDVQHADFDLCDLESLRKFFSERSIAGVIHFAALKSVPESMENPYRYYSNNIQSLLNVVKCCEEFGVGNIIFSSSCSVYGNINTLPVSETTPLAKVESPYAHSKRLGEELLEEYSRLKSLKAISLRYFNPVGGHPSGLNGENPINRPNNLVPVICQQVAGIINELVVFGGDYPTRDGSCLRDFIHVCDIASAHIKAMQYLLDGKQATHHDIFNLGTGEGVSVLEALTAFEKVNGIKVNYRVGPRREGDVMGIYSDSSKAEKVLGWKPAYHVNDMMSSAWKWQQQIMRENYAK